MESTLVTLDGVISSAAVGPPYWDDQHGQYAHDLLFASDALLLGRKTYEGFAQAWPSRTGDDYADRINSMPKYVASTTLHDTTWNATLLGKDIADEVAKLKQEPGQNILEFGTGELDRALLGQNLGDQLHFWVFPARHARRRHGAV